MTGPDRKPEVDPSDLGLKRIPTQERAREKVNRALRAAQTLLEREGVGALSLSRVAKESEISVGALYQYLPDRDAIVTALSVMYYARLEARMDELVSSVLAAGPRDPLRAVLDGLADVYRQHTTARELRVELQAASHPALTRAHKLRMVSKVEALIRAYDLPDRARHRAIARTIFFAADGLMHEAFAEDPAGDPQILAEMEVLLDQYLAVKDPDGPGPLRNRR